MFTENTDQTATTGHKPYGQTIITAYQYCFWNNCSQVFQTLQPYIPPYTLPLLHPIKIPSSTEILIIPSMYKVYTAKAQKAPLSIATQQSSFSPLPLYWINKAL